MKTFTVSQYIFQHIFSLPVFHETSCTHAGLHVSQKTSQDCAWDLLLLLPDIPCDWDVFLPFWQSQCVGYSDAASLECAEEGRKTNETIRHRSDQRFFATISRSFMTWFWRDTRQWAEEQGGNRVTTFVKNAINLIPPLLVLKPRIHLLKWLESIFFLFITAFWKKPL